MARHEILGLITARGGSKSIPKKNLYPVLGKPLLLYTIEAAQRSKLITRLVISTDDEEIAEVARRAGVEVPFLRPKELAEDLTPDLPVFQHALTWLKENENYAPEAVVHLRPTCPLRTSEQIDECVRMILENPEADSVRSVCEPPHTPFTMYHTDAEGFLQPLLRAVFTDIYAKNPEAHNMPRQSLPKVWFHIGDVDVIRPRTILEKKSMTGEKIHAYFQEQWRGVDIDTMDDMKRFEEILRQGLI